MVELEPWNRMPEDRRRKDADRPAQESPPREAQAPGEEPAPSPPSNASFDPVIRSLEMDPDAFRQATNSRPRDAESITAERHEAYRRMGVNMKTLNNRMLVGCLVLWFFGPFVGMMMLAGATMTGMGIYEISRTDPLENHVRVSVAVVEADKLETTNAYTGLYQLKVRFPPEFGNGYTDTLDADFRLYQKYRTSTPEHPGRMWVLVNPENPYDWVPEPEKTGGDGNQGDDPVAMLIIGSIVLVGSILACAFGYYLWRKTGKKEKKEPEPHPEPEPDILDDEEEYQTRNRLDSYR